MMGEVIRSLAIVLGLAHATAGCNSDSSACTMDTGDAALSDSKGDGALSDASGDAPADGATEASGDAPGVDAVSE